MNLRDLIPYASITTLLVAATAPGIVYAARPPAATVVAQIKPLPREENDERTTACLRAKSAYLRLQKIQAEFERMQLGFEPNDDIRPKFEAMITQTNDLITTTRIRVDRCPPQR